MVTSDGHKLCTCIFRVYTNMSDSFINIGTHKYRKYGGDSIVLAENWHTITQIIAQTIGLNVLYFVLVPILNLPDLSSNK